MRSMSLTEEKLDRISRRSVEQQDTRTANMRAADRRTADTKAADTRVADTRTARQGKRKTREQHGK
jgi:hypothetical protein